MFKCNVRFAYDGRTTSFLSFLITTLFILFFKQRVAPILQAQLAILLCVYVCFACCTILYNVTISHV